MSALGGIGAAPLVRRRRLGPAPLWLLALPIGAVLLLPLAFVGVQASSAGWTTAIAPPATAARRGAPAQHASSSSCSSRRSAPIVGAGVAWLLERTDVPGRRFWAVLLALPLAVPEFVNGYAWIGLDDRVHGLWGAVLVSTLSYYPLVMLPAIATLQARGLGARGRRAQPGAAAPSRSSARVTLPQLRLALLGGGLIIALHLLAEYGAFALLGFRTFTTEIYTEYQLGFDAASSAVLSLVLVALCLLLLGAESGLQGRTPPTSGDAVEAAPLAARAARRAGGGSRSADLWRSPAECPIGALVYWLIVGSSTTLPSSSIAGAAISTVASGSQPPPITTLAAIPVAVLAMRYPTRLARLARAQRLHLAGHARPDHRAGARATSRCATSSRSTSRPLLLVIAYAVLFFPLALIAIRPSMAQASPAPRGSRALARAAPARRLPARHAAR